MNTSIPRLAGSVFVEITTTGYARIRSIRGGEFIYWRSGPSARDTGFLYRNRSGDLLFTLTARYLRRQPDPIFIFEDGPTANVRVIDCNLLLVQPDNVAEGRRHD